MSGYLLKFVETSVRIGGRRYPVVKIGNQIWMAENLDWKWDGLDLSTSLNGNSSTPNGIYYNGDETAYGAEGRKCGMLYNKAAKNVVNQKLQDSNVTDWHLPTYTDFTTLKESINDATLEGMKLSSGDLSWASSWNGTNDYGFSALPSGQRYQGTGEYHDAGNAIYLWSTDDGYAWLMSLDGSTITPLTRYSIGSKPLYSIRLVKSLT